MRRLYSRQQHTPIPPQASDRLEAVATEHFWMSGMYWGLTAMALMGRLHEMDCEAVAEWVMTCRKEGGGFGASPRNDAHLLYTLSAVQVGCHVNPGALVVSPSQESGVASQWILHMLHVATYLAQLQE